MLVTTQRRTQPRSAAPNHPTPTAQQSTISDTHPVTGAWVWGLPRGPEIHPCRAGAVIHGDFKHPVGLIKSPPSQQ
eukprot:scaffold99754_cov19-Tisochrysis_lutea.AAC.1